MKYALAFFTFSAGCLGVAIVRGGFWWLLAWPALSFFLVAVGYAGAGPRVLGKQSSGRIAPWSLALFLPFLLMTWVVWHGARVVSRDSRPNEVAPGVWLGRRATARELPPGTRLVVDLTSEFMGSVRPSEQTEYLCVPTLDGAAPPDAVAADLVRRLVAASGRGPVFIHCAQGRGRSAAVAAALLIARGLAANVEEAEKLLVRARPSVRLNAVQKEWVRRVSARTAAVEGRAGSVAG